MYRAPTRYIVPLQEQIRTSKSHDVIAAIHEDNFAGNSRARIRKQKRRGRTYFPGIHVALQWRALYLGLQHISKICDASCRKRLDGARGNRVNTDRLRAKIVR